MVSDESKKRAAQKKAAAAAKRDRKAAQKKAAAAAKQARKSLAAVTKAAAATNGSNSGDNEVTNGVGAMQISDEGKGVWLMEVFNVIYKGPDEIKPEKQVGTIKINDEECDHYLYKVDKEDLNKPSRKIIDRKEELVLTGPEESSISAADSITIYVDLFDGAFKEHFGFDYCPADCMETCVPLKKKIISEDGYREIYFLYAVYDNAVVAHLNIYLLNWVDFATEIYGVVAASTSKIENPEYSSMLFVKRADDTIKLDSDGLLPLARSIVAVPLDSELYLDIHLYSKDGKDIFIGTVTFKSEESGLSDGFETETYENCSIKVNIEWQHV